MSTDDTKDTVSQPSIDSAIENSRRILVVDDNRAARFLLARLLTKMGNHQVETAEDGTEVFDIVKQFLPEIVLLDIGLPGMDGYMVAEQIRTFTEFDDILLVALTGYDGDEDRARSKLVGFDEHLVKPPSIDQMKDILGHPKLSN
jgi:CheY-like chemotaxis protein